MSAANSTAAIGTASGATASVPADGVTTVSFTITLLDANKKPVANAAVTVAPSGKDTTVTVSGLSNASGVITGTVSSTLAQTETLTITAVSLKSTTPVTLGTTLTVTFTQIPIGVSGSSIAVSPTSVSTDSGNTATVTVTVVDVNGKPVANQPVAFSASGTNVTLGAASATTGSAGTATTTVASTTVQSGVTVTATVTPTAGGSAFTLTSGAIAFTPGNASQIVVTTSPQTPLAGDPFSIVATVEDAQGNTVTSFGGEVVLSDPNNQRMPFAPLSGGPQDSFPGILAGFCGCGTQNTITVAQAGVARFPGLLLNTAGTYSTVARATSLGFSGRGSFTLAANVPVSVSFLGGPIAGSNVASNEPGSGVPSTCVNGTPFSPALKAAITDIFGNVCTQVPPTAITLLSQNSTFTATGTRNATATTSNGVATFPSSTALTTLSTLPTSVSLVASATVLTPRMFGLAGPGQIQATLANATGFTVGDSVSNGAGATGTVNIVSGNTLTFTVTGGTWTLGSGTITDTTASATTRYSNAANASTLSSLSNTFSLVAAGSACKLVLQPVSGSFPSQFTAGTAVQCTVSVTDNAGNPATVVTANPLNVSFQTVPNAQGRLPRRVATSVTIAQGQTTSAPLSLQFNGAGTGFHMILSGSDGSVPLADWVSPSFDVRPAGASQIAFTQANITNSGTGRVVPCDQTGNGRIGVGQTIPLTVTALDPNGNVDTSFQGPVSIGFTPGTAPAGVVLNGGSAVNATAGVATFNVSVANGTGNAVAAGYQLRASAATIGAGVTTDSNGFDVVATGTACKLAFVSGYQPTTTIAGGAIGPEIRVQVVDPTGAPVALNTTVFLQCLRATGVGTNGAVSFKLGTGFKLGGALATTDATGLARFPNVTLSASCVGMQLLASANNLTNAASAAFDILPAPAVPGSATGFNSNGLVLAQDVGTPCQAIPVGTLIAPPDACGGGIPVLQVYDAYNNVATTYAGTVTVTIAPGTPSTTPFGGFTSGSTTTVRWVSGVAVFDNLALSAPAASNYRFLFETPGFTSARSRQFSTTSQ